MIRQARDEARATSAELADVQRALHHVRAQLDDEFKRRRDAEFAHFQVRVTKE